MKFNRVVVAIFSVAAIFGLILSCSLQLASAQEPPTAGGIPAHLVVTVEPRHGSDVPAIPENEVMVYEGHDRDSVTEWIPAAGDRAALDLYILMDDSSGEGLGSRLDDLRQFINAQAPATKVGVAYMQNGRARIEQDLTADHGLAAKALRLPLGEAGINASPYISLTDLVKHWPAGAPRREVVMISDGIDRYYESADLQDPYLAQAIDDAVRAGILVSAIYNPGAGHFGHSYWQSYWGQIYLSQLAERTGGEAYYIGFTGAPVSFTPYLDDFGHRLGHQYFLTFLAKPPKKAGWQQVRLGTEVRGVDLISAGRVYVTQEK
jgi:hypothetical protein